MAVTNTVVRELLGAAKYCQMVLSNRQKSDVLLYKWNYESCQLTFFCCCFKASLTLEEKQKLAKEQEQAQKLKSQQPLKPQVHTPIAPVKQVRVHFFVCTYTTLKESGSIEPSLPSVLWKCISEDNLIYNF